MSRKLRADFHPRFVNTIEGFNRDYGTFYIGFQDDEASGALAIPLTISARPKQVLDGDGFFASMRIHYDAIEVLRELQRRGFLVSFEESKASTFYDVFQALHVAGISTVIHDDDYEMIANRKMYEMITEEKS